MDARHDSTSAEANPKSERRRRQPVALTTKKLDSLQRRHASRIEIFDSVCPGLFVRATEAGSVSFAWRCVDLSVDTESRKKARAAARSEAELRGLSPEETEKKVREADRAAALRRSITLGHYPAMSLDTARERCRKAKAAHRDDALEQFLAPAPEVMTVERLADKFIEHLKSKRKRPVQPERLIRRFVIPEIGKIPVASVTPANCGAVLETAVPHGPVQAMMTFRLLRQMFRFAQGRALITYNPAEPVDPKAYNAKHSGMRRRYLSAEEIGEVWRTLSEPPIESSGWVARYALRILMLVPSRQGAFCHAEWKDVDLDNATWTIPPERQKTTKEAEQQTDPLVLPLSPLAVEMFRGLREITGHSRWVLASPKSSASGHFTEVALTRSVAYFFEPIAPSRKVPDGRPPLFTMPDWRPHDLRRTFRTHARQALRAKDDVAERCLGHVIGDKIDRTYNLADLQNEMRELLERWALFVLSCANPKSAKVVPITAAGKGKA